MGGVLQKKVYLRVPFSTPEFASLAYDVLNVDTEIKGSGVQRQLTVDGTCLQIYFVGEDLKRLRVATNAHLKNVLLIVKTINQINT